MHAKGARMFKTVKYYWQVFKQVRQLQRGETSEAAMSRAILREAAISQGGDPLDFPEPKVALSDEAQDDLIEPDFDRLYPETFTLTDTHVALIRQMRLSWNGAEAGAPQQDHERPFTGGDTINLLRGAIGSQATEADIVAFLIDRRSALQNFCADAALAPGTYKIRNISYADVERALGWLEEWADTVGVDGDMQITLSANDIALSKAVQWTWPDEGDMYGAFETGEVAGPTVDPKRPYGDMSYIDLDIHRVLEWPVEAKNDNGYIALTDAQTNEATRLHFRQLCALQALLECGDTAASSKL